MIPVQQRVVPILTEVVEPADLADLSATLPTFEIPDLSDPLALDAPSLAAELSPSQEVLAPESEFDSEPELILGLPGEAARVGHAADLALSLSQDSGLQDAIANAVDEALDEVLDELLERAVMAMRAQLHTHVEAAVLRALKKSAAAADGGAAHLSN